MNNELDKTAGTVEEPLQEPVKEKTIFQKLHDGEEEPVGEQKGWLNIKPYEQRTEEEKHNLAVLGGKARAEEKRKRRTLKEDLIRVLESDKLTKVLAKGVDNEVIKQLAEQKNITVQDLVTAATILQSLEGNIRATELVRDTIGERPKDQVEVQADVITASERALIDKLRKRHEDSGDIAQKN